MMAKKRPKQWYIKERHNQQLGTYYVACGQMTEREASRWVIHSLYGENVMHGFESEQEYKSRIAELRKAGKKVM